MGIFRQKHFKAALGATLGVVVVALAVIIAGSSVVAATGKGGFEETGSLKLLKSARGVVADWAQTEDGRDWVISGEWTLDCTEKCVEANFSKSSWPRSNIDFDMAFAMYRESVRAEGNSSHGHQFRDFSATNVTLAGDTLIIDGQITGSSGIGTGGIQIKLRRQTVISRSFSRWPPATLLQQK